MPLLFLRVGENLCRFSGDDSRLFLLMNEFEFMLLPKGDNGLSAKRKPLGLEKRELLSLNDKFSSWMRIRPVELGESDKAKDETAGEFIVSFMFRWRKITMKR